MLDGVEVKIFLASIGDDEIQHAGQLTVAVKLLVLSPFAALSLGH